MKRIAKTEFAAVATLGVDIGKKHLPSRRPRQAWRHRAARALVPSPGRGSLGQHGALPGRHGVLRRRSSPGPARCGPWPRRASDSRQVRPPVLPQAEERRPQPLDRGADVFPARSARGKKQGMEERSSRRIRNLVTQIVDTDMTVNEIECARISMVARSG
jgi:hypothetical protein